MEWQPIETAPKDGFPVMLWNSDVGFAWIGQFKDRFISGFQPENPWQSLMLNVRYSKNRYPSLIPTHWMPLPEPPK